MTVQADRARPVERPQAAWLMPPEAYTSEAWFTREQEQLFGKNWYFAGMADDLPEVGDYLCVQVGPNPLVVIRGNDGEVRAFHNLCRHRGAQLLEGTGNARRGVSCFYHQWRYSLEGDLKGVPQKHQFPELAMEELGLLPAGIGVWNGMVFVHPDPAPAEDVTTWLGDMATRMAPFQPLELMEVSRERHEMKANWKLLIENHIDGYHLWHLHAGTIKGLDHAKQEWWPTGRHWSFYEPPTTPGAYPDAEQTGLRRIRALDDGGFGSAVQMLFPNLGVAGGSSFWVTVQAIPVSAERTIVEVRTRIEPIDRRLLQVDKLRRSAQKALASSPLAPVLKRFGLGNDGDDPFNDLMGEDLSAGEAVQRGMRSPRFSVGPMAQDYENAITAFQQNVLDAVGE